MSYAPPDPSTYRVPSAGRRALLAGLWLIPSLLFYVGVPYEGLTQLSHFGISTGYSLGVVLFAGVSLAVLGAVRSFAKPTAAYGPLSVALSAGSILYLLYLAGRSTVTVGVGGQAAITLAYGTLLVLFAIVPAIRIVGALCTTVEDWARPKERLPFDYPAPPPAAPGGAQPSGAPAAPSWSAPTPRPRR